MATRHSDDPVYVAVGIDFEQNKLNLLWAIENFPGNKFCIIHVHQPSKSAPLVARDFEMKTIRKIMDDYLQLFFQASVRAEMMCAEMDDYDVGKGILELIYLYGIKKLVMGVNSQGAAANKHYSDEMMDLRLTKAKYIQHRVPRACQIYYVCNGYHTDTVEGGSTGSSNGFQDPAEQRTEANEPEQELHENYESDVDMDSCNSSERTVDELYGQLDRALAEAEKYKQEAYEESQRRAEAEIKANNALSQVQAMESLWTNELRRRKETEEAHQRTKKQQQIQASVFNSRIKALLQERDNVVQLVQDIAREEKGSCSSTRENEEPPSCFVCPILQEVMEDPHVPADGYTYEGEAVRRWLASGHNTSPITNLELRDLKFDSELQSSVCDY